MATLGMLLIIATVLIYPLIVVRAALRHRQWALDTLQAMRYVGGDLMTTSAWLAMPPERDVATADADPGPVWLEA